MAKKTIAIFFLALFFPLALSAGEFTFLPDHPGKLTATVSASNHKSISRFDTAAYKKNLEQLRNLLAKQPVFNPPRGVEVIGYFRPNDEQPATSKVPIPGFGYLRFHFYHVASKTGKPVRICCTTDEIYVSINDPGKGLDLYGGTGFASKVIYEPEQIGEMGGFPVYRMDNGDEVIVMARPGVLPWIPVTREEYVKSGLKYWQGMAAQSSLDTLSPQIASNHQAALAAMSIHEAKIQARYHPHNPLEPTLAPIGSEEGRPLVRVNPAWFDPSLPRSAFQLITLRFSLGGLDREKPGPNQYGDVAPYRVWQALHSSNWQEVGGALAAK